MRIVEDVRNPARVVRDEHTGHVGLASGSETPSVADIHPLGGLDPPNTRSGDRGFCQMHRVRSPTLPASWRTESPRLPQWLSRSLRRACLGIFGAGGLSYANVERALSAIEERLSGSSGLAWGANLIHSPNEAALENRVADLYVSRGVRKVEASAFMQITPSVVRYALAGLSTDPTGRIVRRNSVFAKVSRPEVAAQFMTPAPPAIVSALVDAGKLTAREAQLAQHVAVAEDITVEADSGGHTDNRPLPALLPEIVTLRDELASQYRLQRPVRVGAAGGLGSPLSVAGAFAMGAAYVMTGSVNQACVESGLSARAAPCRPVWVLPMSSWPRRPTCSSLVSICRSSSAGPCSVRGPKKLYELYVSNSGLHAIVGEPRRDLEKKSSGKASRKSGRRRSSSGSVVTPRSSSWPRATRSTRWPWYSAGIWASRVGGRSRVRPTARSTTRFGAGRPWARSTAGCATASSRHLSVVRSFRSRSNLLEGAAQITRAQQARTSGVPVPTNAFHYKPRPLAVHQSYELSRAVSTTKVVIEHV